VCVACENDGPHCQDHVPGLQCRPEIWGWTGWRSSQSLTILILLQLEDREDSEFFASSSSTRSAQVSELSRGASGTSEARPSAPRGQTSADGAVYVLCVTGGGRTASTKVAVAEPPGLQTLLEVDAGEAEWRPNVPLPDRQAV